MAYKIKKSAEETPAKPKRNNPWHESCWDPAAQKQIITALGVKAAAGIARSVGCVLTSTEPNREFQK